MWAEDGFALIKIYSIKFALSIPLKAGHICFSHRKSIHRPNYLLEFVPFLYHSLLRRQHCHVQANFSSLKTMRFTLKTLLEKARPRHNVYEATDFNKHSWHVLLLIKLFGWYFGRVEKTLGRKITARKSSTRNTELAKSLIEFFASISMGLCICNK